MKVGRLGLAAGLASLTLLALMWSVPRSARTAAAPTYNSYASGDFFFPPYPSDNDRMGWGGPVGLYNPVLRAGWYYDWGASAAPPHPGGMEYARTIGFTVNTNSCGLDKIPASQRSQVVESITGTALIDNLRANPGALWLIGNEPDSIYNCSPIMPELYAEIYHEFYTFIKTYDPSAKVALGAIVQPSPLRLEYLDKVLSHYQTIYGAKLPTDLWNIHNYAFREVADSYGAGVPPGASSNVGWTYDLLQWMDVNLWVQNLRTMRQWMADRGERDKPLIVTEFGQVVPEGYQWSGFTFTPEVSRDILQSSFSRFLTETDTLIGYPADINRLVQFWAWFPLYDSFYGGDLVNLDGTLTLAGTAFAQISSAHYMSYADLYPIPLITPSIPSGTSGPVSVTLAVQLDNHGNTQAQSVPMRFAQYDYASGQLLASNNLTVSQVFTRYGGVQPQVSAEWLLVPDKMYTLTFEIDPMHVISQTRRSPQKIAYRVGWAADLAAMSLTADLASFKWIEPTTTTLTAAIRNVGNLTSTSGLVRFSIGGVISETQDVPAPTLAPNASANVTTTLVIAMPGIYIVTATLQYAGLDPNPQNNTATLNILAATHQSFLPLVQTTSPPPGTADLDLPVAQDHPAAPVGVILEPLPSH